MTIRRSRDRHRNPVVRFFAGTFLYNLCKIGDHQRERRRNRAWT
jgi:hypothetical protein